MPIVPRPCADFFFQDKLVEPSAHVRLGRKDTQSALHVQIYTDTRLGTILRSSQTRVHMFVHTARIGEPFFVVPRRVSICLYTKRGLSIFSSQDERVQIVLQTCHGKKICARSGHNRHIGISGK